MKTAQYLAPVFKSLPGLLSPPQTIISLPVHTNVCDSRPTGAVVVSVALQVSVLGLYLPPVLKEVQQFVPPQIIISSPVQTATEERLGKGAFVTLVAVQLSVPGLYLLPLFKSPLSLYPPSDDHFVTVQTVSWPMRFRRRWSCWWLSNYP